MSRLGDALRRAGLNVISDSPVPGRPYSFDPRYGVLDHHTVSTASDAAQIAMLKRGRSDLPGPLCQVYVCWQTPNAVAVISEGRANHAGRGGMSGVPTSDGNRWFRGIEVGASGATAISGQQLATLIKTNKALLEYARLSWVKVYGHKEWTSRKIDIRNNMNTVRALTRTAMEGPTEPPPPPPPPEDEVTDEDLAKIITGVTAALRPDIVAAAENAAAAAVLSQRGIEATAAASQAAQDAFAWVKWDTTMLLGITGDNYESLAGVPYDELHTHDYWSLATRPNPELVCGCEGDGDHEHGLQDHTHMLEPSNTGGVG